MKHLLAIAAIALMPTFAHADIEDNEISIDNSGNAIATGADVDVSTGWGAVEVGVHAANANAAGVNMACTNGTSCSGNKIVITNSGEAVATGSALAAGVNMNSN